LHFRSAVEVAFDGDSPGVVHHTPPGKIVQVAALVKDPADLPGGSRDASVEGDLAIARHFSLGNELDNLMDFGFELRHGTGRNIIMVGVGKTHLTR